MAFFGMVDWGTVYVHAYIHGIYCVGDSFFLVDSICVVNPPVCQRVLWIVFDPPKLFGFSRLRKKELATAATVARHAPDLSVLLSSS